MRGHCLDSHRRFNPVGSHIVLASSEKDAVDIIFGLNLMGEQEPAEAQTPPKSKSFWDRAIMVALVTALLGTGGYFVKLFIERDTTDLVVRAEAFEQAIPLDGSAPTYDERSVYCEAVRFQLVISHNQKGTRPVRLKRVAFEAKPVDVGNNVDAKLEYRFDASALQGFGIVDLKEYAFLLDGERVSGQYLESRERRIEVDPGNIFASTKGTTAITVEPKGDSSVFQPVVVVETLSAGFYQVRLRLHYEIAGNPKEKATSWVYVFMQE